MLKKWFAGLVLFLVIVSAQAAGTSEHPYGLNKNMPYGILSTDYVTPHVEWATPSHAGKIKVLVLAPYWSQRETIELAQRLSVDFEVWMPTDFHIAAGTAGDPAFAFYLPPAELVHRLLKNALKKNYDVIIVGKLVWSMIPPKQRFEILKKVANGTGFIYVNPPADDKELELVLKRRGVKEGADFITENLPLSVLPAFKDKNLDELVSTCTFGKGRAVSFNYQEEPYSIKGPGRAPAWPCLTPLWDKTFSLLNEYAPIEDLPEMEFVPYEYYQALVAKAVIWAAKKEGAVSIKSISLDEDIAWPASDKQALIEVKGLPSGAALKAVVRDRYVYDRVYDLGQRDADEYTAFLLPDVPAGEYFFDVWVKDRKGKKTYTWASRYFTVKADFAFGDVSLNKEMYNPGEPLEGAVTLPRLPKENEKIILSLSDNYNRLIASKDLRPENTDMSFAFEPFEVLTIMHHIEARLLRDGKEVAISKLDFPIRARLRWDDFNEVVWSQGQNNFLTHLMLRKLAADDEADSIDIGWRGSNDARNIAVANLSHTPYVARYGCFSYKDNIVPENTAHGKQYGCMSRPSTIEAVNKWGETQSKIYGPYAPFVWTHGDETNYAHSNPDICWSETCLAVFRNFLKEIYPNIDELNRQWKTSYKSFDEAMPLTFKDAKKTKNYAPWLTHRLSSDRVFAEFYRRSGQALAKNDPDGRGAGFDGGCGLERPNSGADWWVLSKNLDLLQAYGGRPGGQMEIFRSFAKPEQVRGVWYGTYGLTWTVGPNTVPFCHFFPWYSIFNDLNTTWFWTMGHPGPLSGYAPDMTSMPFFEARTQSLGKIKAGIGKLLLQSERQNDRIAIHFSESSRIAASLYAAKEGRWGSDYSAALLSFNKALEDCGLQYDFVSYEEVENGALMEEKYRIFIMLQSRAVSEEEAEAIREFVKNGGVVIADIIPAILNEKGTIQEKGLLADLFPTNKKGTVTALGRGKTVLLGKDFLAGYSKAHFQVGWKKLEGRWKLLADLLEKEAGLRPKVLIVRSGGGEMPPTEIARFKCGENEFVGLLREYFLYDHEPYKARIRFPYKSHLYDVIEGKYLGFTRNLKTEISYKAGLYCLMRYKVDAVELTLPETASAGTPTQVEMALKISKGEGPSKHCFRVEVVSPMGENLNYYAQNIVSENGSAQAEIPWALNEKPGQYTVMVRDVASGVSVEKSTTLK